VPDVAPPSRFGALFRATTPQARLSRWGWAADVVLAGVITGLAIAATHRGSNDIADALPLPLKPPDAPLFVHHTSASFGELLLAALVGLPLAVRRFRPLTAYVVVLIATLWLHAQLNNTGSDLAATTFAACVIGAYSAVMYSPYRLLAVWALGLGAVLIGLGHNDNVPSIKAEFVPVLVLVPLALFANALHTWKQRAKAAEEEKQMAAQLAVEHERARIARELHDVITHNVSVMVVQAGAARKVMDSSPDAAREALVAVEAGGRAAMAELRHVMGLLTSDDGVAAGAVELAPQPGLDQVTVLAERVRAAGAPVEVVVSGSRVPLPQGVDLVAYRVVQEALTNTLKHAVGARVRVEIGYAPSSVSIDVLDSGGVAAAGVSGAGRGLVGMRERLAVYGGTLVAGPRPTGGYRVSAVIPVAAS
jgi:signal transduction histidine kinase